jgi:hypothetical protein
VPLQSVTQSPVLMPYSMRNPQTTFGQELESDKATELRIPGLGWTTPILPSSLSTIDTGILLGRSWRLPLKSVDFLGADIAHDQRRTVDVDTAPHLRISICSPNVFQTQ